MTNRMCGRHARMRNWIQDARFALRQVAMDHQRHDGEPVLHALGAAQDAVADLERTLLDIRCPTCETAGTAARTLAER
jgi:hypothetical protein